MAEDDKGTKERKPQAGVPDRKQAEFEEVLTNYFGVNIEVLRAICGDINAVRESQGKTAEGIEEILAKLGSSGSRKSAPKSTTQQAAKPENTKAIKDGFAEFIRQVNRDYTRPKWEALPKDEYGFTTVAEFDQHYTFKDFYDTFVDMAEDDSSRVTPEIVEALAPYKSFLDRLYISRTHQFVHLFHSEIARRTAKKPSGEDDSDKDKSKDSERVNVLEAELKELREKYDVLEKQKQEAPVNPTPVSPPPVSPPQVSQPPVIQPYDPNIGLKLDQILAVVSELRSRPQTSSDNQGLYKIAEQISGSVAGMRQAVLGAVTAVGDQVREARNDVLDGQSGILDSQRKTRDDLLEEGERIYKKAAAVESKVDDVAEKQEKVLSAQRKNSAKLDSIVEALGKQSKTQETIQQNLAALGESISELANLYPNIAKNQEALLTGQSETNKRLTAIEESNSKVAGYFEELKTLLEEKNDSSLYAQLNQADAEEPGYDAQDPAEKHPEHPAEPVKADGSGSESIDTVVEDDGKSSEHETPADEQAQEPTKEQVYRLYEAAKEARKQGDYGTASRLLGEVNASGQFDRDDLFYLELGVLHLLTNNIPAAKPALMRAMQSTRSDKVRSIVVHNMGYILEEEGHDEEASKLFAIKPGEQPGVSFYDAPIEYLIRSSDSS